VVGIVLIDTNHEDMFKKDLLPFLEFMSVGAEVDWVTTLHWDTTHAFTPSEWEAFTTDDESGIPASLQRELEATIQSHAELGEKQQLTNHAFGTRPLSIIKGSKEKEFRAIFEAGGGTEEQREAVRVALENLEELDERFTRDQLRLVVEGEGRYVYAEKSGHNIQITEPGVIVEEVKCIHSSKHSMLQIRCPGRQCLPDSRHFFCVKSCVFSMLTTG